MAYQIQVPGPALVTVDAVEFGFSANGVDLEFVPYVDPVPGDQNGGEAGAPIDRQFLSMEARITCEMTKWDRAVADKICSLCKRDNFGAVTQGDVGALYLQDSKALAVVITAVKAARTYTFNYCVVEEAPLDPQSLKHARFRVVFLAMRKITDSASGQSSSTF